MYIVALNGPPYCGKDTLAQMLLEHIEENQQIPPPIKLESLSLPLRSIAYAMIGRHYPDPSLPYDEFKESIYRIGNSTHTGRQLMIHVAEDFLKVKYGPTTLADMFILRNDRMPGNSILIVRDSGFQIEVNPLIQWAGRDNVLVARVNRLGCNFDNDSREWVFHPDPANNLRILNLFGLDELRQEAARIYEFMVGPMGWKF